MLKKNEMFNYKIEFQNKQEAVVHKQAERSLEDKNKMWKVLGKAYSQHVFVKVSKKKH